MRERQHRFIPGDYHMSCDECGVVFRRSEMQQRWDKAWVCKKDWEPKHPQESVRGKSDKVRAPIARPDPNVVIIPDWTTLLRKEDGNLFYSESGEKLYQEGA